MQGVGGGERVPSCSQEMLGTLETQRKWFLLLPFLCNSVGEQNSTEREHRLRHLLLVWLQASQLVSLNFRSSNFIHKMINCDVQ